MTTEPNDCVVVKREEWEAAERMLPKDPDSETPGKEWMIFVEDSWNEMGLCAHSIRSAVENLVAICQDMDKDYMYAKRQSKISI